MFCKKIDILAVAKEKFCPQQKWGIFWLWSEVWLGIGAIPDKLEFRYLAWSKGWYQGKCMPNLVTIDEMVWEIYKFEVQKIGEFFDHGKKIEWL